MDLWGVISCSGTGTYLFLSRMRRSWIAAIFPDVIFVPDVLVNQSKHQPKVEVCILIDLQGHILLQRTNPG